jgi:hypothetical protein
MQKLGNKLLATIANAEPRLLALPDVDSPMTPGGWSRKQVLGHLLDSASNNHQRFVRAQLEAEYRGPKYDQEGCVRVQNFAAMPWNDMVQFWSSYNRFLAHVIAQISADKEATPCFIGDNAKMTLGELAADYLVHLEHHLNQIDATARP